MPLTPDDQIKYKTLYLQTAKPYIKDINDSIASFLQGGVDPQKLETGHRAAHSLTSQSTMMGYLQIASLASVFEQLFKAKVDNQIALSPEILQSAKDGATKLATAVDELEKNGSETDLTMEKNVLLALTKLPA